MNVDNPKTTKLTANRVVLIFHQALIVLTIIGIFIASLENAVPKNWQNAVVGLGGVIAALTSATVATNKYLGGSQNYDSVQADIAKSHNELEQTKLYHEQALAERQPAPIVNVVNSGTDDPSTSDIDQFPQFPSSSPQNVTDVTGVTGDFTMDPNYNPASALDPEPDSVSDSTQPAADNPPADPVVAE